MLAAPVEPTRATDCSSPGSRQRDHSSASLALLFNGKYIEISVSGNCVKVPPGMVFYNKPYVLEYNSSTVEVCRQVFEQDGITYNAVVARYPVEEVNIDKISVFL